MIECVNVEWKSCFFVYEVLVLDFVIWEEFDVFVIRCKVEGGVVIDF